MSRLRHLRINPCFVISFFSPNVFWCSWEAVAAQFWCGRWPGPSWALDDQHLHPCESVRLSYQCGRNQGPTFFQTLSFMDVDGWNMLELGSRGIGDPLVVWVISSAQVFRCCQALVAALKSNETVVDINLASNYLGDKGAEACIVGTLWHLEKNMGTDWFEMSPVWSHVARMAAVSADVLQVKLGWFDFDWTLMTLDVAFWCILMHVDIFWLCLFFAAGHCSFSQRELNHQIFEPGDVSHQGRWGGGEVCPASIRKEWESLARRIGMDQAGFGSLHV